MKRAGFAMMPAVFCMHLKGDMMKSFVLGTLGVISLVAAGSIFAATAEETYKNACAACHDAGVANAPKLGDKAAWAPRLKQGMDTLHQSALKGKNAMPPKGGNMSLADADVMAAVDYMAGQGK